MKRALTGPAEPGRPGAAAPLRALIYNRVSHDAAGKGYSVAEQERENRAECADRGWEITAVLTDNHVGASRFSRGDRPEWRRVTEIIAAGGCDVLVLWESSRCTRDLREYAELADLCDQHNVLLSYSGRIYDMGDPDDRHRAGSDALDSERETARTRKRVTRSVRRRKAEGLPHGKIPYGYRREYDPVTREYLRQVPHEETAPIVREIARRLLAGEALHAVAEDLTRRGIPTPRGAASWQPTQVRRVGLSDTAAGLITLDTGTRVTAQWEPLISEADHDLLVARLTDPARRTWRDGSTKHLLAGLAVCGVCGAPVRRVKNRGSPSYACSRGHCVSRSQAWVDDLTERIIIERLSRTDAAEAFAADDPAAVDAATEARALRARLQTFYDNLDLSAAGLVAAERKLLPQIQAAEDRARRAHRSPLVGSLAAPDPAVVEQRWVRLTMPQRREVIRTLDLVVRIHRTRRGVRKLDPASVEIG